MAFDPNGMLSRIPAEQRLNVFALVIYIPDPLGRFLDDLRRELVPGCNPHAHISVLPPRPLAVDWQVAGEHVRECAGNWAPFDIVLGRIRIFPVTNVIYLELGEGEQEMFRIHAAMNSQALTFDEPFAYHPHITLAQEFPAAQLEELVARAAFLWKEWKKERRFVVDRLSFVRGVDLSNWEILSEHELNRSQFLKTA